MTAAILRRPSADPARTLDPAAHPAALAVLFAATLWLVHPIGYIGGGGDEYQYLLAARCTAEHGFCLPVDHWWRRWPIVAPSAVALRLLGESYAALALVPLGYALGCVALLAHVVARRFGGAAGLLTGIVFAATPLMSELALEMGIDTPELLFALATVALLDRALATDRAASAAFAGLAAGLAIQARPTALTLLPIAIALLLLARRRDLLLPFLAAAAAPSLVEALVYAASAGDPLLGWKLSLGHTRIPSTELLPGVDTGHSPLFNPDYIGGWKRAMGIEVHWTVDGLVNFLANPAVAVTISAALILLVLEWRTLRPDAPGGAALAVVVGIAVVWFGALTYGFAIDPKPRMFLPTLAAAATLVGVLGTRRWRSSRPLVTGAIVLIVAKGAVAAYERFDLRAYATATPALIARAGPGLAADPRTARFLALVPEAGALPLFAARRDQRKLLLLGQADCANAAREAGYRGWRPRERFAVPLAEPAAITELRARKLFFSPGITPVLCVLTR